MSKTHSLTAAFVISCLVLTTVARADQPADHLKVLSPFIGQWVCKATVAEDGPLVKKGDEAIIIHSFRWAIGRNAVVLDWSIRAKSGANDMGIELLGWDQETKTIRSIMQTKSGAQDMGVWTVNGDTLKWTGSGMDAEGNKTTGTVHMKKTDNDAYTWQLVDATKGGEEQPETGVYTFERVR